MNRKNRLGSRYHSEQLDRWLLRIEFGFICALALLIGFIFVVGGLWIIFGCLDSVKNRLSHILVSMDIHWKVGLLLLTPLLYRPVKIFLFRVENAFGLQASGPGDTDSPTEPTTNPQPLQATSQATSTPPS